MKHLYPTHVISSLLIFVLSTIFCQAVTAQCPAGSVSVANGIYTNGDIVCVSTAFNGNVKLNNGAKMVIVSGGSFTGNLDGNPGSIIEVRAGGILNPTTANNLASAITNNRNGKVIFGNVTLANGFNLTNDGAVTWAGNWNQNQPVTITNGACGSMTFSQNVSVQNGGVINNNGTLVFEAGFTTNSGSTINNRGRITVKGDFNSAGLFINQWQAVFLGNNNNFNAGDSVINLYTFVVKNAAQGTIKMRNEGLFWVGGTFQYNSGTIQMNRSNAQVRVGGAFANNASIKGIGNVYVAGSFGNNGALAGKNAAQKLFLNKPAAGGSLSNTQVNGSMVAEDTATYAGGAGNPDYCSMLLPMVIASFKGTYADQAVNLSWQTLTESNGKQFVVEYSTDGLSFAKAGEVAAKGNSVERINYQFRFTKQTGTTLWFRLLMVDLDGRTEYSSTIMVKTGTAQKISAAIFPNPFVEKLDITVSLSKATPVTVTIIDINGRTVKSQEFTGQKGTNQYGLTGLSNLNKGVYLATITAGEEKWVQKIIR